MTFARNTCVILLLKATVISDAVFSPFRRRLNAPGSLMWLPENDCQHYDGFDMSGHAKTYLHNLTDVTICWLRATRICTTWPDNRHSRNQVHSVHSDAILNLQLLIVLNTYNTEFHLSETCYIVRDNKKIKGTGTPHILSGLYCPIS